MSSLELSELLGNYGEFVGAIAVVATLVYLSVQIRANTKSTRSQTLLGSVVQTQWLRAGDRVEVFVEGLGRARADFD